jgi:subtilisin family serine protease
MFLVCVAGLQPDITVPGVSVIAAWTRANSPMDLAFDRRRVAFNSESGMSMKCLHVSGVVGLLRVGTGPPTHGVSVGATRTHGTPTQTVGSRHTRPHI